LRGENSDQQQRRTYAEFGQVLQGSKPGTFTFDIGATVRIQIAQPGHFVFHTYGAEHIGHLWIVNLDFRSAARTANADMRFDQSLCQTFRRASDNR
jgi:hypothetical protein